jgi:hypothetical protein
MPTHQGRDKNGCYYQWGFERTKKYYYPCGDEKAAQEAKEKADKQGRAIEWSKHQR